MEVRGTVREPRGATKRMLASKLTTTRRYRVTVLTLPKRRARDRGGRSQGAGSVPTRGSVGSVSRIDMLGFTVLAGVRGRRRVFVR